MSKRLKAWCEINNVVGEEQAGFRPSRSTIEHIFCLKTITQKYLRKKEGMLYAVFMDFEKAFDRVDRKLLWDKLDTQHVLKWSKCLNQCIPQYNRVLKHHLD